ncbi:MAG: sugar ABC transporter ATP-binding protein [Planctomycetes bacterium]|nr:sugar ABC transporter ATP-binding protein [Planctomycetota bacterium]
MTATANATGLVCDVRNVSKLYPGVVALNNVSFDVRRGELHGVIGKNGAGKSTMVNILAGMTERTSGEVFINGVEMPKAFSPLAAEQAGVYLVPQNPPVLAQRSITENIFVGNHLKKKSGLIDEHRMRGVAREIIQHLGFNIDPDQLMGTLPVDTQKLLLLGRGIYVVKADIFMLDEITASLNIEERNYLEKLIGELMNDGKSIIFISHHLKEILHYCHRITVFRNGNKIITENCANLGESDIARLIVGKEVKEYSADDRSDATDGVTDDTILRVEDVTVRKICNGIGFDLRKNEVLGFAGLEGCGKDELFKFMIGAEQGSGRITLDNNRLDISRPAQAIAAGIAYLPRKREEETVFHGRSIEENMLLLIYKRNRSKLGLINSRSARFQSARYTKLMNIKVASDKDDIDSLSGGNKQKVMLSRIMGTEPRVFILNEPTQGIDVEAKQEILKNIRETLAVNAGVLLSCESVQELMTVCDRIVALYKGHVARVFTRDEFSEEVIYRTIQGAKDA